MKSTFSRTFAAAAVILLLAVVLLGTVFPVLVNQYLTEQTISGLQNDAKVISNLATAYTIEGSLDRRDFLLNLDVASRVSDSDTIICDASGQIILCSDALFTCDHQGLRVDSSYLQHILQKGAFYLSENHLPFYPIDEELGSQLAELLGGFT